jgi:glycosyltransferase involved in cell wall biosynthesis
VKVAHVVCTDSFAGVERYISLVAPRLASRGCEVTAIGGDQSFMTKISDQVQWRPASSTWAAATQLAHLGRQDVVHAHMTAADIAVVLTKPLHRARLVSTLHFASTRGSSKLRSPLQLLGKAMDEQIAISDFVAAASPSTRVLHNGVEIADPGPTTRDRTVLIMQRLESEKETELALSAWATSQLRHSGWQLVIAGRGSKLGDLKRQSAALGIGDSVQWVGFVDDPGELLSHAGLLLATAPAEPFGLTVVEAMARATPVVVADGGAHRETIGDDGWLFPVGDVAACARLLDEVLTKDTASYGAKLRSRQQSLFNIETHVDELLRIYREILS